MADIVNFVMGFAGLVLIVFLIWTVLCLIVRGLFKITDWIFR